MIKLHFFSYVSLVQHLKVNLTHHINRLKKKDHMCLSTDAEKTLHKIKHQIIIILSKLGVRRNFNLIKNIYKKATAKSFILNGKRLDNFPLWLGTRMRQGCPLLLLLFNIILEVLADSIREEKEMKWIPIGREEQKWHDHVGKKCKRINKRME